MKTKILVMLPVALAIILLIIANNIEFKDGFSAAELRVLNFKDRQVNIQQKSIVAHVKILRGPIYPDQSASKDGMRTRSNITIKADATEVSLIVISGMSKMAIIQGVPVNEGDFIEDKKVVKIEAERVLLKGTENKWIYMKK